MTGRLRSAAAALGALVLLVAVVGGLPAVLYGFGGSPLPGQLPGWHRLSVLAQSTDNAAIVLAVIRDCAWLAWLVFTICVLAEVLAAVRGRPAPQRRLGGLQGAAAHLVAVVALAFSSSQTIGLAVPGVQAIVLDSQPVPHDDALAAPVPAVPPARLDADVTAQNAAAAPPSVIVQRGDCLWTIAQRYLGAGDRYPQIAQLNYGRDMGGGEAFTNPSIILPGWRLLLPAAPAPPPAAGEPAPAAASATPAPSHSPAPSPAPARHAGHASSDPRYQRRHPAAADSRPADPPAPAPAPAAAAASRPAAAQHAAMPAAAVFATGALAGAVITTLTRLRFRQRQERRRGRRIALPADPQVLAAEQRLRAAAQPSPERGAEILEEVTLAGALALLEAGLLASGQQRPDIIGVHVTPGLLEVLLAAPATEQPPAPFTVSAGRQGMCWQLPLPAAAPAGLEPAGQCQLLPGLVTVGATGDGYLLLDLEALQVTGCDGPPELVGRVLQTAATELATCRWGGWYELILVGFSELAPSGRAEHCDTLDEALELLAARCGRSSGRLEGQVPADVRALRMADPDDEDWGLTVVVSRAEPTARQLTRLLDLAVDSWGGIAALVAGDGQSEDGRMAPTVLQLAPDPAEPGEIAANVVPLQVTVRPRVLSAGEYDAIGALFAAAADTRDVGPDELPYADYAEPPWLAQTAGWPAGDGGAPREITGPEPDEPAITDEPDEDSARLRPWESEPDESSGLRPWELPEAGDGPDEELAGAEEEGPEMPLPAVSDNAGGVLVQVLGPLAITGTAGELMPKQAELVLALALAGPAGLTKTQLSQKLGADPDHPKPADYLRQQVSRARRRLGPAADGRERILHVGAGVYRAHPEVALDWDRFAELARAGRPQDLRAALGLVRGEPFAGAYYWWLDMPLAEAIRAEVVDAAQTLAELEMAAGEHAAAGRAGRAGLIADPSAEQLWRVVMRAEHADGNLAGVREAWQRCLDVIEDISPGGEPHPETTALYRTLTTPSPRYGRLAEPVIPAPAGPAAVSWAENP